jgi:hypothetical protein
LTAVLLISKGCLELQPGEGPLAVVVHHCLDILSKRTATKLTFEDLTKEVKASGKQTLTFYRQIALFGYFMLDLRPDSVVDWDDLLSETTLAEIFRLPQIPSGPLSFLKTVTLPDDWIDLLLPPYSIAIADMREETGICLLTGQMISLSGPGGTGDQISLNDHMDKAFKNGPILLLIVTGSSATQVVFITRESDFILTAAAVWLDKTGMPDIGLRQGRLLSLNRTLLSQIVDDFISGKFHNLM